MKTPGFKTPEQAAFAELFSRYPDEPGKQKQVAQKLRLSAAMVSKILAGTGNPSQRTLDTMRELVEGKPRPTEGLIEKEDKVKEHLKYLRKHHADLYTVARLTVEALHHQAVARDSSKEPKKPRASSGPSEERGARVAIESGEIARREREADERASKVSHPRSSDPNE